MYKQHDVFKIEKSTNKSIWRYMDFWKFLNLLDTKSLHFSNSESMGDNYEGRIPQFILQRLLKEDQENGSEQNKTLNDYLERELRKTTLISSWCYSNNESFAMWKMYAKDKMGIAIESNFECLKNSFISSDRNVYIGEINYINENKYYYEIGNLFYPFLTKLDFYSFENEVRCITVTKEGEEKSNKLVEIDLNILIKKIHISPSAKPELKMLLEILKEKYNLNFEIVYSKINDNWL